LYFNDGQVDQAIEKFEKVVGFTPNHSNARYSLGVAYEAKGDDVKAIEQFEKVLEMNPGNEDVQSRISELQKSEIPTTDEVPSFDE
jgi:tetratricopeptide (TPR) repeat protein